MAKSAFLRPSSRLGEPLLEVTTASIIAQLIFCFQRANAGQVGVPDLSASAPDVSGGIDVGGAMPSVDVDVPSASASLDVPGESLPLNNRFLDFALQGMTAFEFCCEELRVYTRTRESWSSWPFKSVTSRLPAGFVLRSG